MCFWAGYWVGGVTYTHAILTLSSLHRSDRVYIADTSKNTVAVMRQQENHIYSALTQGVLLHICTVSDCKHTCNVKSCWCLFILWKFLKYPDKHQ